MCRWLSVVAVVGFTALAGTPLYADDSTAALGAGGIVLTKGTPVRMKSEDLYISPDLVRVRFEFANDTDKDVETLVAFPLPDIDTWNFWGSGIGAVTRDPVNFVGFEASVDGKPIAFKVEQRAYAKNKDVTALIASAGAVINPVAGDGYKKLETLPLEQRNRLISAGIAMGDEKDFVPQWNVHTRFYWPQRFPAHKTVVIAHSYQPVTGGTYISFGAESSGFGISETDKEFCMDAPSQKRLRAMSLAREKAYHNSFSYLDEYWTDYVLSTAKNWSGTIGRFHLTLDKLKPDNVLALCWNGRLRKAGPTTVEFVGKNFTPRRDIHMVVFSSGKPDTYEERPR
jgi:hypothetical protein